MSKRKICFHVLITTQNYLKSSEEPIVSCKHQVARFCNAINKLKHILDLLLDTYVCMCMYIICPSSHTYTHKPLFFNSCRSVDLTLSHTERSLGPFLPATSMIHGGNEVFLMSRFRQHCSGWVMKMP